MAQRWIVGFVVSVAVVLLWRHEDVQSALQSSLFGSQTLKPVQVNARRLQSTLDAVRATKQAIYRDWDVANFPLFLGMVDIPATSWEIQKQKFIGLLLAPQPPRFVMGFSGSSVTAGHDNFFMEAFPSVMNRTLRGLFDQAGISLEVRNHAFGNNPCTPYAADCLTTHLGDDLDVVAWEQSMNCGRDPRPIEAFLRATARMPNKPAVWFLTSGSPYWAPEDCRADGSGALTATKLTLVEGKGWVETKTATDPAVGAGTGAAVVATAPPGSTAEEQQLLRMSPSAAAASQVHLRNFTFLQLKTSQPGHVLNLADLYSGVAPIGQNIQAMERYRCLGPYGANFSVKTPGGGQKWHPGKRGHQLRADSLSYFFLSVFEEALEVALKATVTDDATGAGSGSGSGDAAQVSREASALLLGDLQGPSKVQARPLVCLAEECDSPPQCFTNYEPRTHNSISDILLEQPGAHNNWSLALSPFDAAAVAKAAARGMGYLDKKVIFTSGSAHKPLTMRISPRHDKSFIMVCEVQKGFSKYPADWGDLDKAATLLLYENVAASDGKQLHWTARASVASNPSGNGSASSIVGKPQSPKDRAPVTHLSLKHYADQCYRTESVVPSGNHILAVMQRHEGLRANVAYIIIW